MGALLEQFQWLTPDESQRLRADKASAIRLEMDDVLLDLVSLADRLGIAIAASAFDKIDAGRALLSNSAEPSREATSFVLDIADFAQTSAKVLTLGIE